MRPIFLFAIFLQFTAVSSAQTVKETYSQKDRYQVGTAL